MPKHKLPYTVKEVASMYGVCEETVRKEIHSGRLRAAHKRGQTKIWYIKDEWLREWADGMLEVEA